MNGSPKHRRNIYAGFKAAGDDSDRSSASFVYTEQQNETTSPTKEGEGNPAKDPPSGPMKKKKKPWQFPPNDMVSPVFVSLGGIRLIHKW